MSAEKCRCGHTGDGPHPCHADGYSCRQPATARLIPMPLGTGALAGAQMKLTVYETYACDVCFEKHRRRMTDGT